MIDWKRENGDWAGNGFRIQRVGPTRWQLEESPDHAGSVTVESELIAALPTLAACKYTAEMLHDRARVSSLRLRLTLVGLGGWAFAVLVGHQIAFLVAAVVGSAALLELIMTYVEDRTGGARHLTQ